MRGHPPLALWTPPSHFRFIFWNCRPPPAHPPTRLRGTRGTGRTSWQLRRARTSRHGSGRASGPPRLRPSQALRRGARCPRVGAEAPPRVGTRGTVGEGTGCVMQLCSSREASLRASVDEEHAIPRHRERCTLEQPRLRHPPPPFLLPPLLGDAVRHHPRTPFRDRTPPPHRTPPRYLAPGEGTQGGKMQQGFTLPS